MKFTIVVVMLALALGSQASVLPWNGLIAGHGLSHTAVSGPAILDGGLGLAHGAVLASHTAVSGPAIWDGGLGLGHGAVLASGHAGPLLAQGPAWGHAAVAAHAPAAVSIAHGPAAVAVAPIAHEGQYVAKTRGAVHTAPLAGHINSAASVNLAPAPGTI